MNIGPYKVVNKLFSKQGLSFFNVIHMETKQLYLLRLFDSTNMVASATDTWYDLYDHYQLTVTNYHYLPKVHTIDVTEDGKVYTVLHEQSGELLNNDIRLNTEQMEQLLDAVWHLHKKGIIHGHIVAENILITTEGKIVLYGAGEWKIFAPQGNCDEVSDIKQLLAILTTFNDLQVTSDQICTIEQLQQILKEPVKPGLLEKESAEERSIAPPSLPSEEKNTEAKEEAPKEEAPKEEAPKEEVSPTNYTLSPILKWFGGAAIMGSIIAGALFFALKDKDSERTMQTGTQVSAQTSTNTSTNTSTQTPTKTNTEANSLPTQPAEVKKESVSNEDIRSFLKQYNESGMEALKNNDFSIVEPLLDPNGKMYAEQKDYLQYLKKKGISEEALKFEVNDITRLDPITYKVSTYEEYNITYHDGAVKFKSFNSDYLVKIMPDSSLAIHAMINTDQIESRLVRSATKVPNITTSTLTVSEADNLAIKNFVGKYVQNRIDAINQNDLFLVSNMLQPDSEIYKLHERMIAQYGSKGIKEAPPALSIDDAEQIDTNTYAVNTYETVTWHYLDGTTESRDFSFRYIIKYDGSGLIITERIDM